MAMFPRKDRIPIPLKDAQKFVTVCQYCNVGCGYNVYRWPVGKEGGLKPQENTLGIDFTKQGVALQTQSITETMYNRNGGTKSLWKRGQISKPLKITRRNP
jgi:arsenite oxidase large subunit